MDKIIPYISSLGTDLYIIGLAIGGIILVTKFVVKTNIALKETNISLKDIPDIKSKVDLLYVIAVSNGAVFQKNSSAELTKIGEGIVKEIDTNSIIDKNIDELRKLINKTQLKNANSLQDKCFSVVNSNMKNILSDSELDVIKEQSVKYGITIDKALPVFAILLRDKLLKENNWKLEDIK